METNRIPDMIRENFVSKFSSSNETLDEFIHMYEQRIYSMLDNKKPSSFKIYTYAEIMVAYSDFFKIMNIRKKQNIANVDDYYYLCSIDCISDTDDLIAEISAVPAFLEKILKSMYEFYMLSYLGKSNAFRSLSESEHEYLSNITQFHQEEAKSYLGEVTLEDYVFHFQMKQKIVDRNNEVSTLYPEHIINEICGFITDLSKYDYENFQNNVKDLLIFYYEWVKYDCMHEKNLVDEDIEIKEDFIQQFESMSFDEMANDILYDQGFLFFLVDFYCMNAKKGGIGYEDGRIIKYSQVEKYIANIEDEKVKEKIKHKKTRI